MSEQKEPEWTEAPPGWEAIQTVYLGRRCLVSREGDGCWYWSVGDEKVVDAERGPACSEVGAQACALRAAEALTVLDLCRKGDPPESSGFPTQFSASTEDDDALAAKYVLACARRECPGLVDDAALSLWEEDVNAESVKRAYMDGLSGRSKPVTNDRDGTDSPASSSILVALKEGDVEIVASATHADIQAVLLPLALEDVRELCAVWGITPGFTVRPMDSPDSPLLRANASLFVAIGRVMMLRGMQLTKATKTAGDAEPSQLDT